MTEEEGKLKQVAMRASIIRRYEIINEKNSSR